MVAEERSKGSWLREEIEGVSLPDKRFRANVISIAEHMDEHVGSSFSAACGERLRKCAWRLFAAEELNLLSVHQQRTLCRCAGEETILIAEDTTDIHYRQPGKQGMGELGGKKDRCAKGLNMHTALALTTDGHPLGIVHQKIWAPKGDKAGTNRSLLPIEEKETIKWINALTAVTECWQSFGQQQAVLIGDREADFFAHYSEPRHSNINLLVRVQKKNRKVLCEGREMKLADILLQLKPLGEGTVKVWRRKAQAERTAVVTYYSATVVLPPTTYGQKQPTQTMQLVYAKEKEPPAAADAIEWVLLTDLPAATLAEAILVCRYYSFRWKVERFHYVLKCGLLIEQLQISCFAGLANVLQLYSLIAWHLLWLQYLAKTEGEKEVAQYIDQQTVEVSQTVSGRTIKTIRDFVVTIAMLGGFIPLKKQPLPGEKTLWQGLRQLHAIKTGFLAAKQKYGTG